MLSREDRLKGAKSTKHRSKLTGTSNVWRTLNRLKREPLKELIAIADKCEDAERKFNYWWRILELQEQGLEKSGGAGTTPRVSSADLVHALERANTTPKPALSDVSSSVKPKAIDGEPSPSVGGGSAAGETTPRQVPLRGEGEESRGPLPNVGGI